MSAEAREAQRTLVAIAQDPSTPTWARSLAGDIATGRLDPVGAANVLDVLSEAVGELVREVFAC